MRRLAGRYPSPAIVIAFIALLIALSGTAIALPGRNVVDSGDIKQNSIRSGDIRRGNVKNSDLGANVVTSGKVRNNNLTGTDINEGTLGQVPSANSANTANSANSANSATRANSAGSVDKLATVGSYKKVTSSASNNDPNLARAGATEVPLYSVGAFDVYGKCFTDADAPSTYAETFIRTRENGSIFQSAVSSLVGANASAYLDTGTAETSRYIGTTTAPNNSAAMFLTYADEFFAAAPGGTGINGEAVAGAKHGSPAAGDGAYGPGNVCIFGGEAIG